MKLIILLFYSWAPRASLKYCCVSRLCAWENGWILWGELFVFWKFASASSLLRLRLSRLRLSCSRLTCSRLSRSRILRSRHSGLSYSHLFEECCVFPHCVNRMHSCRMRKRDERGDADAKDETRTRKTRCGRVSPALLNSQNNDSNANFFIRINLE